MNIWEFLRQNSVLYRKYFSKQSSYLLVERATGKKIWGTFQMKLDTKNYEDTRITFPGRKKRKASHYPPGIHKRESRSDLAKAA